MIFFERVIIAHLSRPTPVTAPFWETLNQVREHYPAFGAHTGCALQNGFAPSRCPSNRFAIGKGKASDHRTPFTVHPCDRAVFGSA